VPTPLGSEPREAAFAVVATVLGVLGLELCFRGLLHGLLVLDDSVQEVSGRWFLSRPVLLAASLSAATTAVFGWRGWIAGLPFELPDVPTLALPAVCFATALVTGLALGVVRERSASIWPPVLLAVVAGLARLAYGLF
jgi:membrane protease YdiL (CAAX protease family)